MELRITNVGLLRDCVTAVFEKALAEPNFSPLYAQFCVRLSEALPTFPSEEPPPQAAAGAPAASKAADVSFRRLMLNRAQEEFQSQHQLSRCEQLEAMTAAEREAHAAVQKRRMLGTIRFIGELYIRQMIASRILRDCVMLLFGDGSAPVEEDIEALCKLLDTTGKTMETSKGRDAQITQGTAFAHTTHRTHVRSACAPAALLRLVGAHSLATCAVLCCAVLCCAVLCCAALCLSCVCVCRCVCGCSEFLTSTLAQLAVLKEQKALLSSRHRFMIADLLDVQKNGWVNRRAQDTAKKISSIHEEAARQEAQNDVQRMYHLMQQQQHGHGHAANKPSPASRMARPTDRYALPPPVSAASAPLSSQSVAAAGGEQWETVKGGKGAAPGRKSVQGQLAAAAAAAAHDEGEKKANVEEGNAYALLTKKAAGREEKEAEDDDDEEDGAEALRDGAGQSGSTVAASAVRPVPRCPTMRCASACSPSCASWSPRTT